MDLFSHTILRIFWKQLINPSHGREKIFSRTKLFWLSTLFHLARMNQFRVNQGGEKLSHINISFQSKYTILLYQVDVRKNQLLTNHFHQTSILLPSSAS